MPAGLPEVLVHALCRFDVEAADGGLFHDGKELSTLIGRPTPPLDEMLGPWLPPTTTSA